MGLIKVGEAGSSYPHAGVTRESVWISARLLLHQPWISLMVVYRASTGSESRGIRG